MTDQQIASDIARSGAPLAREQTMHPVTLRFADRALESHYHDARLRARYMAGRISALAGAIAGGAFILLGLAPTKNR